MQLKYRKKPIVIEAFKWRGTFLGSFESYRDVPGWVNDAVIAGTLTGVCPEPTKLQIKTLEGVMMADVGDFIIRGIHGELYPCKADIFEATYDAV